MQNESTRDSLKRRGAFISVLNVVALVVITLFTGCAAETDNGDSNDNDNRKYSTFYSTIPFSW